MSTDDRTTELVRRAAQALAYATHAKVVELAHERLRSRLTPFLSALSVKDEADSWSVVLEKEASWIDDGLKPYDMRAALLQSPKARTAKDGHRYLIIPFKSERPSPSRQVASSSLSETMRELGRGGKPTTPKASPPPSANAQPTFRVMSGNSPGWRYPGLPAANIMEDAQKWAMEEWERLVLPELAKDLLAD